MKFLIVIYRSLAVFAKSLTLILAKKPKINSTGLEKIDGLWFYNYRHIGNFMQLKQLF